MSSIKSHLTKEFLKEDRRTISDADKFTYAKNLFHHELEPYFRSTFGERWIMLHKNKTLSQDWIMHLIGINSLEASRAINAMCNAGKVQYIPTPLEFRSACKAVAYEQQNDTQTKLKFL
ncbi:hypothetical protein VCHA53O466_40404 [Vibrio chagasii]|nr:hypothetical protein VCHA53O466_40404 [Vibrio chagasii]